MNSQCKLSNNTRDYVERFQYILDEMIDRMTSVELTESISESFIRQMIPHHRAAIEMSENLLQYTTNIPLQNIALNIIASQTKSIENMMAVYPQCRAFCDSARDIARYQRDNEHIIRNMFYEMGVARISNSIDANFMREMIPHHQGAIRMSENALRYPLCPGLIPLLDAIIVSQKKGARQMQRLLWQIEC